MQKKQSQVQQAKYAAVHETRSHEDRRTAAELSARLQKLRTEHQDTAAQAAADLTQRSVSSSAQQAPLLPAKEKKPWPVKVVHLITFFWQLSSLLLKQRRSRKEASDAHCILAGFTLRQLELF